MRKPLRRNALAVAIAMALPLMLRRVRTNEQHQHEGAMEIGEAPTQKIDVVQLEEKAA